jgi:hypothetical protein
MHGCRRLRPPILFSIYPAHTDRVLTSAFTHGACIGHIDGILDRHTLDAFLGLACWKFLDWGFLFVQQHSHSMDAAWSGSLGGVRSAHLGVQHCSYNQH